MMKLGSEASTTYRVKVNLIYEVHMCHFSIWPIENIFTVSVSHGRSLLTGIRTLL